MFENAQNKLIAIGIAAVVFLVVALNSAFYAEPGYNYHIRTAFGTEKVAMDAGWEFHWFGRYEPWKKELTVQSLLSKSATQTDDSGTDNTATSSVTALGVTFLGNVNVEVESTSRFRLPTGEEDFLRLARAYRTQNNFVSTALLPAMKETLQSTAGLMTADDYYAGSRSLFAAEYENQLINGLYLIRRVEQKVETDTKGPQTAIAQKGTEQGQYGDSTRTMFVTEKQTDDKGVPLRKPQQFRSYNVDVVEARVTDIEPNADYKARMVKVQQALADLAVARQNRAKEEENKLLVIAQGEKEVEERRQTSLKEQIEKTTSAETEKQLALIDATKKKEQAETDREAAKILLDKARIDAESIRVTADAEAYAKQKAITADNGLDKKLETLRYIADKQAAAVANAKVPSIYIGGGGAQSASRAGEVQALLDTQLVKNLKQLSTDLDVKDSR